MQSAFVETSGELDVVDITSLLRDYVKGKGEGFLTVFLKSTTSGLLMNEADPALIEDLRQFLKIFLPKDAKYKHNSTWGDSNGHSHLRSIIFDRYLMLPVSSGELMLGQWQRVFLVELDVRPRRRELVLGFTRSEA